MRSIVLQSAHDKTDPSIFVSYSNRRPEDAVFLDELTALAETSERLTFRPTITEPGKSHQDWTGSPGSSTRT